jgi:putative ABC transport system permease protein
MSIWRQLTHGVRVLTRRAEADSELDDELRHFLDEASAESVARGASPAEATRDARLAFGTGLAIREEVRSHGWEHLVDNALADLRCAGRGFRRRPGFAAVAALTLALGVGASTAIFSVVYPILFAPLPYPHPDRLVRLADYGREGALIDVTYGNFHELLTRSLSFAELAAMDRWKPALTGLAEPERVVSALVTSRYFRALGVFPAAGRDFTADDDRSSAPRVAILSDGLARRRFGSAGAVLGRPISLDGDEYVVIGVMPGGFEDVLSPSTEVWVPRRFRANASFESAEWGHHMRVVGRLAPGVSLARARQEVAAIGGTRIEAFPRPPWASMTSGLAIESLQISVTRRLRPALLAVLAAVALLLVIAGVNVTNLLLARGAERAEELAMRAALGARRERLIRQLLTETLLLSFVGGGLGLGVAAAGVHLLVALAPEGLPRAGAIQLDSAAFAAAAALTTLVGLGAGLAPALHGAGHDLHGRMPCGPRTTGQTSTGLRRALVAAEIALALVLLVGAGLMMRSISSLLEAAPGFDTSQVLTMQVEAAGHRYDTDLARLQLFDEVLDAVRRVPGVQTAAFTSQLPLSGDLDGYGVQLESAPRSRPDDYQSALRYAVTPQWFATMGIPLRRGRLLDSRDRHGATSESIVISESMARRQFRGRDPIGQRLRAGPEIGDRNRPWDVVVGVVGDVKQTSLALEADDAFYVAMGQWGWVDDVQSLVVRTTGDARIPLPEMKRAIWSVDRDLPIIRVATMDEILVRSEAERLFVLTALEAFGLAALALAAIGVFGMVSGSVTERRRELGVRAALGASRAGLLALVLRQGLGLTAIGIGTGICGAALASGALRSLLFGVTRADTVAYLGASTLVLVMAAAASAIPAARAARVDPSLTLRA